MSGERGGLDDGDQDDQPARLADRTAAAPPVRKPGAEARLAQALRANLRRRKGAPGAGTPPGDPGD